MATRRILISLALFVVLAAQPAPASLAAAATYADWAKFVADVTIPDGTVIAPGAAFTKTWRLTNIGTATWTTSYKLVFESGEALGAKTSVAMPKTVKPGESVDLTVNMTAPATSGTFRGNWKLQNASGVKFGIGSAASNPFWVEIKVASGFGIAYDFTAKLCDAIWSSAKGKLPCPGATASNDGYVRRLDAPKYENGLVDSKPGILAVPQNVLNGYIAGVYPAFRVQPGDKFQAVIGCEPEATGCYVRFRLDYRIGTGGLKNFWAFYEKLDGQYYRANVDLSPLAGQDVRFILTVHTAGLATGDRAIWGSPVILRGGSGGTVTPATPTATATPTVTITPGGPTLTPTATPPPSTSCDRAAFVADITVPDGTTFTAGSNFTKIWRLKNVGTCTWTSGYRVVFADGDAMSAAAVASLPRVVKPGEMVDISIKMAAPNTPGTFRGNWKLKNPTGGLFGIGSTADKSFWVEIKVAGVPAGGAYDFLTNACQAEWRSGTGVLPCPGVEGDARGFVLRLEKPTLETGTASTEPGLLSVPQNIFNGYIQATYPAFRVQAGDRFQSIVNCESGAVNCYVRFRLDYQVGSEPVRTFWSFLERYEGQYYRADVDLSALAGKDVRFILFVSAAGFASGDRALWVAPRITRVGGSITQTPPPVVLSPTPTRTQTPGISTATATATATTTATPTSTPVTPSATPLPDVSLWSAYLNSTYGFTFKVPPASSVTASSNESARILIPLLASGTNLIEKYADVAVVPGASTCVNPNPGADPAQNQNVTINSVAFLKQAGAGAAAGNRYDWVGYSTLRNGNCISVTFVLHSGDPGNYTTPPPLFDKAAESGVFNTIINTFAFWP